MKVTGIRREFYKNVKIMVYLRKSTQDISMWGTCTYILARASQKWGIRNKAKHTRRNWEKVLSGAKWLPVPVFTPQICVVRPSRDQQDYSLPPESNIALGRNELWTSVLLFLFSFYNSHWLKYWALGGTEKLNLGERMTPWT